MSGERRFDQTGWLPAVGAGVVGVLLMMLGRYLQVVDDAIQDVG